MLRNLVRLLDGALQAALLSGDLMAELSADEGENLRRLANNVKGICEKKGW
jgi:hypothetical protein